MANVKRVYVFATSLLSGIAVLLTIVSLATEEWVVTNKGKWISTDMTGENVIKYGLFQGSHKLVSPQLVTLQLTMTCLVKKNACALLCAKDSDGRYSTLEALYNNDPSANQPEDQCPAIRSTRTYNNKPIPALRAQDDSGSKKFINCGVWISTVVFLSISVAFGLLATALAVYNTVTNPVEAYLSLFGLYIYNAVAFGAALLAVVLWGVMHLVITFHDIGIFYTLVGQMTTDKAANLGYSYWILLIPLVFYLGSICVLYLRLFLISRDPGQKIVQREESADPVLILY